VGCSEQKLVHNVDSFVVFHHARVVIESGEVLLWFAKLANELEWFGKLANELE
jgi:hypothetical protein